MKRKMPANAPDYKPGLFHVCDCGSHMFVVHVDEETGWSHLLCAVCDMDHSMLLDRQD